MSNNSRPKWLSQIDYSLLDAFVDNPFECPIVIDKDGIVRFMSRHNVGLYGFTPEQAVGKHITEIGAGPVNRNTEFDRLTARSHKGDSIGIRPPGPPRGIRPLLNGRAFVKYLNILGLRCE